MPPSSSLSQSRKQRQRLKEPRGKSPTPKPKPSTVEHPLLESLGVTEIPPVLKSMGVTPESLDRLTASDLRPIVQRVQTLSRKLRYEGPTNDDELHAWVKTEHRC